jgi:hypothetical protein
LKVSKFRALSLFIVAAIVGLVPLAGTALAAPAVVVTDLNPDTGLPPGELVSGLTFSISPDSRTLTSFTLTPPSGYEVGAVAAVTSGSAGINGDGAIEVSGLSTSPSQTTTVTFSAKTSCLDGLEAWGVVAKDSQNRSYNVTGDHSLEVEGYCDLAFVNQPSNTKAGELITSGDRQSADAIQVKLVDDLGATVTHFEMDVTFDLGSDPSGGDATLTVGTETTVAGVATFDDETPAAEGDDGLEIDTANVAEFTEYTLVPLGASLTSITGPASAGFDIWEDATRCGGPNCALSHDGDEYFVPGGEAGKLLSASTFTTDESNIDCDGYEEITSDVVWHEYTGTAAVLVKIHITKTEMKKSANNGQALVGVCVGLVDEVIDGELITGEQKWADLGVVAEHQNSDGVPGNDIWVALAPDCPSQMPDLSAPCIDRQYGDGAGGSYTEVWIPGGDPPRRT